MKTINEKLENRIAEIRELYGMSESEMIILTQVIFMLRVSFPDLSPELITKILKTSSAMYEALLDETKMFRKDK